MPKGQRQELRFVCREYRGLEALCRLRAAAIKQLRCNPFGETTWKKTLQVLLFILWVTSVGLHFPIDRFFRGFSEKAILSAICQMFILDISVWFAIIFVRDYLCCSLFFINSIDNYFGISQCQSECQKAGSEIIVVVWSGYAFQCMKEVCCFLSLSILKSRNDM